MSDTQFLLKSAGPSDGDGRSARRRFVLNHRPSAISPYALQIPRPTLARLTRKQGHSEFSDISDGGLAEAEVTGGEGTRRGSAKPRIEEKPYGATVRNLAGRAAPEL